MADLHLAGDMGGTKTNLALYENRGGSLKQVGERSYVSADYPSPDPIIIEFLAASHQPAGGVRSACFGIAGPIRDGYVQTPNLPWTVSEKDLERNTGLKAVELINDLAAMAHSIPVLEPDSLVELNAGLEARGNAVLLAAGTGLGQALLFWNGHQLVPSATEGGHTEFAPENEEEIELLRYMWTLHDHVSWEWLVSGMGLVNIYNFLKTGGREKEEAWLKAAMAEEDPGAVIGQYGLSGKSPLCARTVDIFINIYGRAAGNLALKGLARGGVYVGGGIAPKLLPAMTDGRFMAAYGRKGRMSELVMSFPVRVIMDQQAPLLGAARRAVTGRSDR